MDKNKTLLIVEDDANFRESLGDILKEESFNVLISCDGVEAKDILTKNDVDIVITDIRMPRMHGIELLHYIKRLDKKIPVIFITGFSDILEITEAYEVGADGFLAKPFGLDDLLECIKSAISNIEQNVKSNNQCSASFSSEMQGGEISINKYCKIDIDVFRCGSELTYPIYLRLGNEKYVKITHAGSDLSRDRIIEFKKKGILFLYIEEENYPKYIEFYKKFREIVSNSDKAKNIQKVQVLHDFNNIILSNCSFEGYEEKDIVYLKDNLAKVVEFIKLDGNLLKYTYQWMTSKNNRLNHSMSLVCLCLLLAKEKGIEDSQLIEKLTVASFFHEIGMNKIPAHIQSKDIIYLTEEEFSVYKKHPILGADMLKGFNTISGEIIQIIEQHHERADGSGFPHKKSVSEINPIALIIGITDEFLHLIRLNDSNKEKIKSAMSAISEIEKLEHKFIKSDILALKNVVEKSF